MAHTTDVKRTLPRVREIRDLTESTYVLSFDRRDLEFEPGQYVSCDMIYEAFDILKGHGVPPEHLYAEVYF